MVPVFEEVTNKFMERINEKINDQPKAEINVHPLITQFAVDVLGNTSLRWFASFFERIGISDFDMTGRTVCNIDFEALDGKAAQPLDDLYFLFRNMSNPYDDDSLCSFLLFIDSLIMIFVVQVANDHSVRRLSSHTEK